VSKVRRILRAFHRDPRDDLAGQWQIDGLSLADLQELFGVASDDLMYGSFPVTEAQVEPLRKATGIPIDLLQYDYFVDADALLPAVARLRLRLGFGPRLPRRIYTQMRWRRRLRRLLG
jgi:hypothetical protein